MYGRFRATRYNLSRDDETSAISTLPSCCLCFAIPGGGKPEELITAQESNDKVVAKREKDQYVGTLRAVGLQVAESTSRKEDYWFLKVSAAEPVLKYEAEQMRLKLRMKKAFGGGLYPYQRRLQDLYDKSTEGDFFSSLQQLQVVEKIILAKRDEGGAELDIEQMIEDKKLDQFFYLHHDATRRALVENWAKAWTKMQPLEQIREYFGEKVALYFTWIGFYTQALWIPAMMGIILTGTQLYTYTHTDSLDNPWVPLYCAFTALWAVFYLEGWKRLEMRKKLEWDTEDFEEQEEERKEHEKTETRTNPITGERESYYPHSRRRWRMAISATVVTVFIVTVVHVVCGIMTFKYEAVQKWGSKVGGAIGGIANAVSIMVFNAIYALVVNKLTEIENWRTETEFEDALIAKDFLFKFINAYFALFFVAFIQNYVPVYGVHMPCPNYSCMPVLTMTLATVFATQIVVQQSMEIGIPKLKNWWKNRGDDDLKPQKPEEEQSTLEPSEGVFDDYNEMVVQFGYVTLFAAAFPLTATLALINNIMEIRIDAMKMVLTTQRARYTCAADIGTWMTILEILTTISIMTNVCLVSFTSHGLYFYIPDMNVLDRIWVAVVAEHVLLFIKAVVEGLVPDVDAQAVEDKEVSDHKRNNAISRLKALHQAEVHDEDFEDE